MRIQVLLTLLFTVNQVVSRPQYLKGPFHGCLLVSVQTRPTHLIHLLVFDILVDKLYGRKSVMIVDTQDKLHHGQWSSEIKQMSRS
jgi:hypothetical protein